MTLEVVARNRRPMTRDPDTETFQKILRQEYLVNEQEQIAEVPHFPLGEHDTRGANISLPADGWCS